MSLLTFKKGIILAEKLKFKPKTKSQNLGKKQANSRGKKTISSIAETFSMHPKSKRWFLDFLALDPVRYRDGPWSSAGK